MGQMSDGLWLVWLCARSQACLALCKVTGLSGSVQGLWLVWLYARSLARCCVVCHESVTLTAHNTESELPRIRAHSALCKLLLSSCPTNFSDYSSQYGRAMGAAFCRTRGVQVRARQRKRSVEVGSQPAACEVGQHAAPGRPPPEAGSDWLRVVPSEGKSSDPRSS